MAMAAAFSASATQLIPKISPGLQIPSWGPTTLFRTQTPRKISRRHIRAAEPDSDREEQDSHSGDSALSSQDNLKYLVKLGAGSVAGAAAIKYGSVVFPALTRPNLVEALSIISFPVIIAVLLLSWKSRSE